MAEPIRHSGCRPASWMASCGYAVLTLLFIGCPVDDPGAEQVADSAPDVARTAEALAVAGTGGPASRQVGTLSSGAGVPAPAPAVAPASASAANSLPSIADNALRQAAPFANNGTGKTMGVSSTAGQQETALLRFDQAAIAAVAAGKSVYSAKLKIAVTPTYSGWNGGKIAAHRMTRTWTERSGTTGATWRCAADTNVSNSIQECTTANRWGMNTGDVDPLPYVAQATDTVRVYSDYFTIYLTLDVTADVRSFLSGTANHGWMLRVAPGGVIGSTVLVSTKEDIGWGPQLILDVGPDLCPSSAKVAPEQCGCAVPDVDTDQDGTADCAEPSLVPSADSDISRSFPYVNDGTGIYIGVATTRSSTGVERSLIRFSDAEIAAAVGGNVVHEAFLELTVSWSPGGWAGGPIDLYPMNRTWAEGVGWDPGPGSTWDCASDPDTRALNSGSGDCTTANRWKMEQDSRPYSTTRTATVAVSDSDTVVRFDVTADVRKFVTGTANNGWIMIAPESPLDPGWLYFASRETETPPRLQLKIGRSTGKICNLSGPSTQCGAGQQCRAGVGDRFGWSASTPVCWPTSCDTMQSPTSACGTTADLCGLCQACTPNCTGKSCGSDGCGGTCGGTCDAGEAGCTSNLDCSEDLMCGMNNGPRFGKNANTRVCWPEVCDGLDQSSIPCGSATSACGLCPACEPSCDGRSCGSDGCGGSCGTCGSGTTCNAGLGVCQSAALSRRFELPPGNEVETVGVGTLPGEFSVAHGGSAAYEIPLEVPPGRGGIEPELSLRYSGTRGNGRLGVGWALEGLSAVTRCNKTVGVDGFAQAPLFAFDDAFCLDGQRLMPIGSPTISGANATIRYRTEEDRFTDVSASFLTVPNTPNVLMGPFNFTARAKDGRIFTYGYGVEGKTRKGPNGLDMEPFQTWAVSKIADRPGNAMTITYAADYRLADGGGLIRDYYPTTITYGSQLAVRFFYTSEPEYPQPRPDAPPVAWHYGTQVRQDHLLRRISTSVDGEWVRHYEIAYTPVTGPDHVKIATVKDCAGGADPAHSVCKPATSFSYRQRLPGLTAPQEFRNASTSMSGLFLTPGQAATVLDLNGDGLDDLLFPVNDGSIRWFAALSEHGAGGVVQHRIMDTTLTQTAIARQNDFFLWFDRDVYARNGGDGAVIDWDNDGRQDLLEFEFTIPGQDPQYTVIVFNGSSFTRYTTGIPHAASTNTRKGLTLPIDVDGDGYRDLLICDAMQNSYAWRLYRHHGGAQGGALGANNNLAGFTNANREQLEIDIPCTPGSIVIDKDGDGAEELLIPSYDALGHAPGAFMSFGPGGSPTFVGTNAMGGNPLGVSVVPSGVRLLDMNGDGLRDILRYDVLLTTGQTEADVVIEINKGDGLFDIHTQHISFSQAFTAASILGASFGLDADLDGNDDLILPMGGSLIPWLSDGRNLSGLGAAIATGMPASAVARPMDVNGDGILGVQAGTSFRERELGVHDRLEAVSDGLGATTQVLYKPFHDGSVYTSTLFNGAAANCKAPLLCLHPRGMLVSGVLEYDDPFGLFPPPPPARAFRYTYKGAMTGAGARGSLGFEEKTVDRVNSALQVQSQVVETFRNRVPNPATATTPQRVSFPFAMRPSLTESRTPVGALVHATRTTRDYAIKPTTPGSFAVNEQLRTVQRGTYNGLLPPGPGLNDVLSSEVHRVVSRDDYNNVLESESTLNSREKLVVKRQFKHQQPDPVGMNFRNAWLISHPTRIEESYTVTPATGTPVTQTRVTSHDYFTTGLVFTTTITDPALPQTEIKTEYARSTLGNPTSIIERGSGQERITGITYDARDNYPISVKNALQQTTQVEYDPRTGELETVKDPNGIVAQARADGFGRPALQLSPTGEVTETNYSWISFALPFAVTVTSNAGPQLQTHYDLRGHPRVEQVRGPRSRTLRRTLDYDNLGQPTQISRFTDTAQAPVRGITYDEYDNLGRPRRMTLAGGETVRQCYDLRTACSTNPRGFTTCSIHDDRGRPIRMLDPVAGACETVLAGAASRAAKVYTYGPFDAPATITDLLGNVTKMSSDAFGRPKALTDPDRGKESADYDAFGQVVTQINGNTQTSRFEYDPLGRLKLRRDVNARGTNLDAITTFTYDGGGGPNPPAGQLIGHLTSTSSPDGVDRTFFFNSQTGNLERTTQRVDGATFETRFEFDPVGRLDRIRYPSAANLPAVSAKNVFDDAGFLTAVRDGEAPDTAKPHWTLSDTDLHGQLTMETYGNGLRQSRTYDPHGLLDVTRTLPAIGTPSSDVPIFALDVDYDANGNVRSRNTITRNQRETYAYDAHDRLTSDSFANSGGRTFSYDTIGRRTPTSTLTYDPAHIHAIRTDGTFTYTYDAAGNRTRRATASGALKRFDYTFFGKPKAIWDELTPGRKSNEVTLRYDADMSRAVKTLLDPTTHAPKLVTTYMGGLYEQRAPKPSGNPEHIYYITNGSRVVAQISMLRGRTPDEIKKSYLHDDNLGSPRIISDGSAGFKEFDYDAFGTPRNPNWASPTLPANTTGVTIGFTAQEMDDEHALINMEGRLYDPRTFQFITPDPFVQAPFSSTGLNRYAYVMHNPLTLIDPSGFDECKPIEGGTECNFDPDPVTVEKAPPAPEPTTSEEPKPQEETKPEEMKQPEEPKHSEEPKSDFGDHNRAAGDVDSNHDADSDTPGHSSGERGPSIRAGEPLNYFSRYIDRETGRERLVPWERGEPMAMDWFHYGGHEVLNVLEIGGYLIGGGLKVVTRGGAEAIVVAEKGLAHVLARHFPGGALTAGKSLFNAGETVPGLVKAAESVAPVLQPGGNFQRIVQAGREIGIDRATGLATKTYTVITDAVGNLVTMFPGVP